MRRWSAATLLPWLLLGVVATARLYTQMAAMPPYAGLDELYHVARLAFTLAEGRSPGMREASIPPYLAASEAGASEALPAFGVVGEAWPKVVAARRDLLPDRELGPADLRPYVGTNYESQQPALYYLIAAPMARMLPQRTALSELRVWRAFSVVCALLLVLATATIAVRVGGSTGLLAAALIVSLPTWLTLVVRAGSDAFACMLIAAAFAVTLRPPSRLPGFICEGLLWGGALAAKLYSWPAAVVLPFLWRAQRAPKARVAVVMSIGALAVLATVVDLAIRTNNPLGLFAFDRPEARPAVPPAPIAWGEMLRIWIASFAWTSGQHVNALRPFAIAMYLGPLLVAGVAVLLRHWRNYRILLAACGLTLVAFAVAQAVNAAGYIRAARAAGLSLPAGGKEGWYWYALVPLGVGIVVAIVLRHAPGIVVAAFVVWLAAWDVTIHEGALFQDFAGTTTSDGGDRLFRWGPRTLPFARELDLQRVAVGPGASQLPWARAVHLGALAALAWVAIRRGGRDEALTAAREGPRLRA